MQRRSEIHFVVAIESFVVVECMSVMYYVRRALLLLSMTCIGTSMSEGYKVHACPEKATPKSRRCCQEQIRVGVK